MDQDELDIDIQNYYIRLWRCPIIFLDRCSGIAGHHMTTQHEYELNTTQKNN